MPKFAIFFLLAGLLVPASLRAAEEEEKEKFRIVQDMQNEWLVYDKAFSTYIPFEPSVHGNTRSISMFLGRQLLERYNFYTFLRKESCLLLNNKIVYKAGKNTWFRLSAAQARSYGDTVFLTVYHPGGQLPAESAFFGYRLAEPKQAKQSFASHIYPRSPYAYQFENFFILGGLGILLLLAISRQFNYKVFDNFYTLRRNQLSLITGQNFVFKKPLNTNNLYALFIHSLILVFACFIIQYVSQDAFFIGLYEYTDGWGELLFKLLLFSAVVFLVYILKYLLIFAVSQLFNLREFRLAHYFNSIKLSMLFYAFFLPVCAFLYIWNKSLPGFFYGKFIYLAVFGFTAVKIAIISYNLNKIRPFRNLYLFSYLCATELIPLFIAFKLVIV